jgi:choline dehydrogenase-like flavoprotein
MKKALIVGSGAGGATVAKELQGTYQVSVLEAGYSFRPFSISLSAIEKVKKAGLLFSEKEIRLAFPPMKIGKTGDGMVLVKGMGHGGSTTISAGNGLRRDRDLKMIGLDLEEEFRELYREIPISADHQNRWRPLTQKVFSLCQDMQLEPELTPKMIDFERCAGCGKCVLGCSRGAKWDSRNFLNQAVDKGATLVSGCKVQRIVIENGRASGVVATRGWRTLFYPADLIILAAGGLGTPALLQQSGIECQASLFVDPVLCVSTKWEGARQNREIPMPFIVQKEHFIISPYFDFLSFFFNRNWRYASADIFSLMIKLADTNLGQVSAKGVRKVLTETDKTRLREGVNLCTELLQRLGVKKTDIFLGTLNAGHPGGTLPLTEKESATLHHDSLPSNLYVADASLFPNSLGNPPILTIAAMAKRVGKICRNSV